MLYAYTISVAEINKRDLKSKMDEEDLKTTYNNYFLRSKNSLIKRQLKRRVVTSLSGDFGKLGNNYLIG
jgi:hypothetical protein